MINDQFKDKLFNKEDEDKFTALVYDSANVALSKVGGVMLPAAEWENKLYEEFKKELISKL
jgi:hypothetical protein